MEIYRVEPTEEVLKDLNKMPIQIGMKFQSWIDAIGKYGLRAVRKIKGYRDEKLKGDRAGQHSIRLNKAYRAIYIIEHEEISFIRVIEVSKHDY